MACFKTSQLTLKLYNRYWLICLKTIVDINRFVQMAVIVCAEENILSVLIIDEELYMYHASFSFYSQTNRRYKVILLIIHTQALRPS